MATLVVYKYINKTFITPGNYLKHEGVSKIPLKPGPTDCPRWCRLSDSDPGTGVFNDAGFNISLILTSYESQFSCVMF